MSPRLGVILIGGLGTRLGELARETPKPMLPVNGRPFLEHLLAKAAGHGLGEILLLAGHRAEVVDAWLADGAVARRLGLSIRLVHEPEPMGTGGALLHARAALAEDFLLLNGDTWFDFDWRALTLRPDTDMVMALRLVAPAGRYETLVLNGERVVAVRPRQPDLASGLINAGVYRLRRAALDGWSGKVSLEADILPALAKAGRLDGRVFEGDFIDIGLPESYAAAGALLPAFDA